MPSSFHLTAAQRAEFEASGVLRLPGLLPAAAAEAMAGALWEDLARRFGALRGRSETWSGSRPAQFQALERSGAFDAFAGAEVTALAEAIVGPGPLTPAWRGGQPLVSFPTGEWDIPHRQWHFDLPVYGDVNDIAVARLFTFLEPVRPRGGGTLFVVGSHQAVCALVREAGSTTAVNSSEARKRLRQASPWFDALFSPGGDDRVGRFMRDGADVWGVPVRVEEMTGEPGDVLAMHPAVLHAGAPNGLDQPRLMLTQFLARG
jgi:hypothetical protein